MNDVQWIFIVAAYAMTGAYAGLWWYGRYSLAFREAWPPIAIGRSIWVGLLWPVFVPFGFLIAIGFIAAWIFEVVLYPMFYAAFVRDPESKIK